MTSYAVVGASRGIGLEYVRQLATRPHSTVFAVVRSPSSASHLHSAIDGLHNVHVVAGDVEDYSSLQRAARELSAVTGGKLDVLVHVAARMDLGTLFQGYDDFPDMDALDADLVKAFTVNVLGVIHSVSAFLPLLRASSATLKKVIVLGSRGGDPSSVRTFSIANMAAYGITKAAVITATVKWAVKLKDEGFAVVTVCPGTVDTSQTFDRSGIDAKVEAAMQKIVEDITSPSTVSVKVLSPEQSVAALMKIMDELKPSDNGLALSADGPWST